MAPPPRAWPFLAATLLLAGCAAPPPPGAAPPPPPAVPGAGDGPGGAGQAPTLLVEGDGAHVRVALVDRRVEGGEVALTVDVRNKDAEGSKAFGYALLGTAAGDTWLDMPGRVDAGREARFSLRSTDAPEELRSPWSNLTLFYQEHAPGAEFTHDELVVLDLRGRGLPRNVR